MAADYSKTRPAWDKYIGIIWRSLIECLPVLDRASAVVEIAPGVSPKIALALKQLSFEGDVYLVDPNSETLKIITTSYKELLPKANIHPILATMDQTSNDLPSKIDAVYAHHPLDDMLLSYNLNEDKLKALFNWTFEKTLGVKNNYLEAWELLQGDLTLLNRARQNVLDQWVSFIDRYHVQAGIISQYPSLVLETFGGHSLNQEASQIIASLKSYYQQHLIHDDTVQKKLDRHCDYSFPFVKQACDMIKNEVLVHDYWMVFNRNKNT